LGWTKKVTRRTQWRRLKDEKVYKNWGESFPVEFNKKRTVQFYWMVFFSLYHSSLTWEI